MEAVDMAAATATQEAFLSRGVLEDTNVSTSMILQEDNKACIIFAVHPKNHRNSEEVDF